MSALPIKKIDINNLFKRDYTLNAMVTAKSWSNTLFIDEVCPICKRRVVSLKGHAEQQNDSAHRVLLILDE